MTYSINTVLSAELHDARQGEEYTLFSEKVSQELVWNSIQPKLCLCPECSSSTLWPSNWQFRRLITCGSRPSRPLLPAASVWQWNCTTTTLSSLHFSYSCCQKVKMPSDVASGNQSAWEGYRQFAQVIIGCKSANCVCTVEQQSQSTKSLGHMHHQSPHLSHTLAMITMHKHTLDGSDPGHRAGRSCCERPVLSQTLLAHIFIP